MAKSVGFAKQKVLISFKNDDLNKKTKTKNKNTIIKTHVYITNTKINYVSNIDCITE